MSKEEKEFGYLTLFRWHIIFVYYFGNNETLCQLVQEICKGMLKQKSHFVSG
jgi:hypothetical protein